LNVEQLIAQQISRKIKNASVTVTRVGPHFEVTVKSDLFLGLPPIERQQRVYLALDRVPVEVLARVCAINCIE